MKVFFLNYTIFLIFCPVHWIFFSGKYVTGKRIAVQSTHVPVQLQTGKFYPKDWVESVVQQIAFSLSGMS